MLVDHVPDRALADDEVDVGHLEVNDRVPPVDAAADRPEKVVRVGDVLVDEARGDKVGLQPRVLRAVVVVRPDDALRRRRRDPVAVVGRVEPAAEVAARLAEHGEEVALAAADVDDGLVVEVVASRPAVRPAPPCRTGRSPRSAASCRTAVVVEQCRVEAPRSRRSRSPGRSQVDVARAAARAAARAPARARRSAPAGRCRAEEDLALLAAQTGQAGAHGRDHLRGALIDGVRISGARPSAPIAAAISSR